MSDLERVDYEDLDYANDHRYYQNSKLFTGVGLERDEAGHLVSEIQFLNGHQHGWATEYYLDGSKKGETPYIEGMKHGIESEWAESGQLVEQNVFEFDVLLRSRLANKSGKLVDSYIRPEDDSLYQHVLMCRSRAI